MAKGDVYRQLLVGGRRLIRPLHAEHSGEVSAIGERRIGRIQLHAIVMHQPLQPARRTTFYRRSHVLGRNERSGAHDGRRIAILAARNESGDDLKFANQRLAALGVHNLNSRRIDTDRRDGVQAKAFRKPSKRIVRESKSMKNFARR